jgi:hypothetical protein
MRKIITLSTILIICIINGYSQDTIKTNTTSIFAGYDFGEMAFNKFQNFAGEIGLKFKNDHMIRFTYMNVKLTEQHLSSSFAGSVDGDNVKGLWNGYELLYDIPIVRFKKMNGFLYGGLSAGYHKNSYHHTILNESLEHETATVGFDVGYRETNIFKIKGLYFNFQIPFHYNFKTLEETKLGDTTINKAVFEQSLSFFVGYEF